MHRFFLSREAFSPDEVIVSEPGLVHRLRNVLRLRPDDVVVFLDGSGWEFETVLRTVESGHIVGQVQRKNLCVSEPRIKITLYQAVLKADRLEWALQKGTEVGVSEFVPLISEYCVVLDAQQLSDQKLRRWERVIQAAAEQSRRGRLPPLQPLMLFSAACERVRRSGGLALIAWENETAPLQEVLEEAGSDQKPFNVSLFVGPEGGFSATEVQTAQDYGIVPVSLGPRVLRAETAGVVGAALILYQYGDLRR
jgi:16S rRNA (uracil1498-N3)-methyltransferase